MGIRYRFRDRRWFQSKIAKFSHPLYFAPPSPLKGLPLELGTGASSSSASSAPISEHRSIAVSTSWRHFERSYARIHAVLRPRLWGQRSSSIVRSHVRLGRPARRRQSARGRLMAARRMREWSCGGSALARCPNRRRTDVEVVVGWRRLLPLNIHMLYDDSVAWRVWAAIKAQHCHLPVRFFNQRLGEGHADRKPRRTAP